MTMKKIAFNFDGVIADTGKEKIKWFNKKGINVNVTDKNSLYIELSKKLSMGHINEIYKEMSENIFIPEVLEKTEPIKGAIEAIKKLSQSFTIYIITSRPAEMIKDVNRWLINYDLRKKITGIFSSSYRSKQDICLENHIVFLCDDDIRHIL